MGFDGKVRLPRPGFSGGAASPPFRPPCVGGDDQASTRNLVSDLDFRVGQFRGHYRQKDLAPYSTSECERRNPSPSRAMLGLRGIVHLAVVLPSSLSDFGIGDFSRGGAFSRARGSGARFFAGRVVCADETNGFSGDRRADSSGRGGIRRVGSRFRGGRGA